MNSKDELKQLLEIINERFNNGILTNLEEWLELFILTKENRKLFKPNGV